MTNGERYNLSAAVFTALTDVECEIDGLLSYDRAVIKMGAQALHQIHSELIQSSLALNREPVGESLLTCWQALVAARVCEALLPLLQCMKSNCCCRCRYRCCLSL